MFWKRKKKDRAQAGVAESKDRIPENEPPPLHFQERPRICLIDVEEEICKSLQSSGFNCSVGTLGAMVEVPNRGQHNSHACLLNCVFPQNLHEYDIVVIDLQNPKRIQYRAADHTHSNTRGQKQHALVSSFPETLFDPRPLSSSILRSRLEDLLERETLFVVFAAENEKMEYFPVRITAGGSERLDSETHWTYDFFSKLPSYENITGRDTKVVLSDDSELGRLLRSHNREAIYRIVFRHPTYWEQGEYIKISNFIPLMIAGEDQIVSFAFNREKNCAMFFPEISCKKDFLLDLFQRVLPEELPRLFPYYTQFAWRKDPVYRLPKEKGLLKEKASLQSEYNEKMREIEQRILANREQYRYLHDLLTQSGSELVKTVESYFKWLGFKNVVNVDETSPQILEEDLQVETEKGLLVVEVKGIGGTSTDSECSQISKVKYRRSKERGSFDVYGLYLVNHERFPPPEKRTNPPFNKHQIQDAENDKRGLLSTYDLFKLYFNIEGGFVTKEEARSAFFKTGLVRFPPSNAVKISPPYEIYYNGYVAVVQLEGIRIATGMGVILDEDGKYRSSVVKEIKIEENTVDTAESGKVGIKLADKITKRTQLWIKQSS